MPIELLLPHLPFRHRYRPTCFVSTQIQQPQVAQGAHVVMLSLSDYWQEALRYKSVYTLQVPQLLYHFQNADTSLSLSFSYPSFLPRTLSFSLSLVCLGRSCQREAP